VAGVEPRVFEDYAGTGVVVEATSLPQEILTNFFVVMDTQQRNWDLKDTAGHPLHLVLPRKQERDSEGRVIYDVRIWSDGPNGVDERGRGDDLVFTNKVVVSW